MNDGDLNFNYLEDDRDDYKNKYPRYSYITNCLLLVTIVSQPKPYCDEILHHLNINTEFNSFWISVSTYFRGCPNGTFDT